MPQVNNLMGGGTPGGNPTAVAPTTQPPPQTALSPAAQTALASPIDGVPKLSERPIGAYVGSASMKSQNWPTISAAGIAEGDFYLDSNGQITKLMPFKYWLFTVTAFCTRMDNVGNIVTATEDPAVIADQQKQRQLNVQEHYVTVTLVDLDNSIVPAKTDFRHTKSGAVATPVGMLRQANDPAWVKLGDAYRVAAQFPHPFGRVYCTANTTPRTVRGGPNAGLKYFAATAVAVPTPLSDMERLAAAMTQPMFTDQLNQVVSTYNARIQQIRSVLGK